MPHRLHSVCVLLGTALACPALAQTATITITHDDPDGIVEPGQTVRINYRLSWTGAESLGTAWGDAVPIPDSGTAANPGSELWIPFPSSAQVVVGTPVGGSVIGFLATVHPFPPVPNPKFWQSSGVDMLWYDWTAPGPAGAGTYQFDFAFAPQVMGSVFLYVSPNSPQPVPTTVHQATLVVTPAPAGLAVLAVGGVAIWTPARRIKPGRTR